MNDIFPRSPREKMCGWVYLPRFVDKTRLHLAGKLGKDYQENFQKGFDAAWLKAAGFEAGAFIERVKNSVCDGEICDWVAKNSKASDAEKESFNAYILNRGQDDDATRARLEQRKKDSGLGDRAEITTFVDYIDADEKRI